MKKGWANSITVASPAASREIMAHTLITKTGSIGKVFEEGMEPDVG